MAINYRTYRNIESSLADHLRDGLDANFSSPKIEVRVGKTFNEKWKLPVVVVYWDSAPVTKLGIGENRWIEDNTLIIDIFSTSEGLKLDLASFIVQHLREGFDLHTLAKDGGDQSQVIKTPNGTISVSIIGNDPIDLGDNVDKREKYRQRITITVTTVEL